MSSRSRPYVVPGLSREHMESYPGTSDFIDGKDRIIDWFKENCRDPWTDSSYDVGFVGRHTAEQIIEATISDSVPVRLRLAAIEELEASGPEYWETGLDLSDSSDGDAAALFSKLLEKVALLETAVGKLAKLESQIGHNGPPEPIDEVEFGQSEYLEIASAIQIIRFQNATHVEGLDDVRKVTSSLASIGHKLRQYTKTQADRFVTAAVKSAGAETGKWVVRLPAVLLVSDLLIEVCHAIVRWLASLGISF